MDLGRSSFISSIFIIISIVSITLIDWNTFCGINTFHLFKKCLECWRIRCRVISNSCIILIDSSIGSKCIYSPITRRTSPYSVCSVGWRWKQAAAFRFGFTGWGSRRPEIAWKSLEPRIAKYCSIYKRSYNPIGEVLL